MGRPNGLKIIKKLNQKIIKKSLHYSRPLSRDSKSYNFEPEGRPIKQQQYDNKD